jgi:hypothetical protein
MAKKWEDLDPAYRASFDAKHEAYEVATMNGRVHGYDSDEYTVSRMAAEEIALEHRKNFRG